VRIVDAHLRRPQLLGAPLAAPAGAGWRRLPVAYIVLSLLLPAALHGGERSPRFAEVLEPALDYLATTHDELGFDVVVLLELIAELTTEDRPEQVAARRLSGQSAEDLRDYGPLLGLAKPVLEPAAGAGRRLRRSRATESLGTVPAEETSAIDASPAPCLVAALDCRLDLECRAYVEDERAVGLSLTHQAVWLLFVRWSGCSLEVDLEELHQRLAERLLAEQRADPVFSEVMLERLATLGHLGSARRLEPRWVATVLEARHPAGCWPVEIGGACHPHPTVLALWALAHADRAGRWPR
jgi:hypothetical protein